MATVEGIREEEEEDAYISIMQIMFLVHIIVLLIEDKTRRFSKFSICCRE